MPMNRANPGLNRKHVQASYGSARCTNLSAARLRRPGIPAAFPPPATASRRHLVQPRGGETPIQLLRRQLDLRAAPDWRGRLSIKAGPASRQPPPSPWACGRFWRGGRGARGGRRLGGVKGAASVSRLLRGSSLRSQHLRLRASLAAASRG